MNLPITRIFSKNLAAYRGGYRRALNEGGTSSSKTYSILEILILIAQYAPKHLIISVVSESMPHLKRGCIRDFMAIMGGSFEDARWNKTEHTYTFGNGIIEFFSADEPSKMRGGRRDILFINEANNIAYESYRELDIRTRLFTFMDWNPVAEFWAHENRLLSAPENVYIHSTYLDAIAVLPAEVVANIESNRGKDPNWWNVYGLGLLGKVEGLVYPQFQQIDALPEKDGFYGLDFGYSNDPSTLVHCVVDGKDLYCQELFYETGMTNDMIAHRLDELGIRRHYDEIFADSAEPKSIDEIAAYGFNIKPAPKGPGSVEYGHQKVRQYRHYWTKDSLRCIKEQRNFRYIADKLGKLTDKTTHTFSHGMDARRYAVVGVLEPREVEKVVVVDTMQAMGVNMDLR